ncbi:MAG TPA: cytochrome d ubiquinol oxidase subunit II [Eggerthellaceae bacterium]|nr:cytochrome d ubiquinol oxidase subunit II [Eggerthellaceae bacterium]
MTGLGILWFFLIFLLIAGYFVFDGFDLGAGVLYPFLAKTDEEKALVRRSIGPVWDGNEVWLLTAGGALFAAFAPAYATTFSGFYLAIMLVLFGLILRGVSLEFATHDTAWRPLWNACFFVGSLLPALLFGVAVGNIYAGIPMNAAGDYIGIPLLGLVTPFTLLCGLLGLAMFAAAGAAWIALKAPRQSELRTRAVNLRFILQIAVVVLFLVVSVYGHFIISPHMAPELGIARWACVIVFALAIVGSIAFSSRDDRDLHVFVTQSLAAVALVFLLATSMFPNLVVASAGSTGSSITIATAASSDLALGWMTGIACIGVPLVLAYHVMTYRIFYGRLAPEGEE